MLQKLPLSINSFSVLRLNHYLYVDKTKYIYQLLIGESGRCFLSRPRRFGKSLLVSTIKEVLEGNKKLFNGLWIINSDYQWKKHAVISLDFSKIKAESKISFNESLCRMMQNIAKEKDLTLPQLNFASDMLDELVIALHKKYGSVAILIDEYDRPLLHNLGKPELALEIRKEISDFFSLIKANDEIINFAFITGVSSFIKAGLFSGINNLQVLTVNDRYGSICGYTDEEIETNFSGHIQSWADQEQTTYEQIRTKIKSWYNGYRFAKKAHSVYNPFSIGYAMSEKVFENYWFASGIPTFLVTTLKERPTEFNPDTLYVPESLLGTFDIGKIPVNTLLFQAGYLTITGYNAEDEEYLLDYPNLEVKNNLQRYLLEGFVNVPADDVLILAKGLKKALEEKDLEHAMNLLRQLFAQISYIIQLRGESFYHSLLQMALITAGIKAKSEYSTSHGRIDLVVEVSRYVYLMEIKFNKSAKSALDQIKQSEYAVEISSLGKEIVLVGINFKRKARHFSIAYVAQDLSSCVGRARKKKH